MIDSSAGSGGIPGPAGRATRTAEEISAPPAVPGRPGTGAAPAPRRGRRIWKWLAFCVALLVLGTAGAGYAYYRHLNGNIRKGERSSGRTAVHRAVPNALGQTPLNILLIGSDSRDSTADLALGGARGNAGGPARADVEMLLHVSADRQHAAVISIPRDTRVDIPQCTDPKTGQVYPPVNDIINASLERGGPGCTLATWQNLTGIYIDHWMMVDFAGVVRMADAVGGVDVCVRENLWDHPTPAVPHGGSGLKLTAGAHRITGRQALQWLRTRDAFGSDLGRAKAQHMYLASLMRELRAQDVFTDPGRLTDLAETATKSIEVSSEIGTVAKLYGLGQQLKNVPPDHITMATMPNIPDPQDPQAHLLPAPGSAARLFTMVRDDVPLDAGGSTAAGATASASPSAGPSADPAGTIAVDVLNGTAGAGRAAVSGRATAIGSVLAAHGFARARVSPELVSRPGTSVVYPAAGGAQARADAEAVAAVLRFPAGAVKASAGAARITVTIGADWTSGTDYAAAVPPAGDVPTGADTMNGDDTHACMDVYRPYQW